MVFFLVLLPLCWTPNSRIATTERPDVLGASCEADLVLLLSGFALFQAKRPRLGLAQYPVAVSLFSFVFPLGYQSVRCFGDIKYNVHVFFAGVAGAGITGGSHLF